MCIRDRNRDRVGHQVGDDPLQQTRVGQHLGQGRRYVDTDVLAVGPSSSSASGTISSRPTARGKTLSAPARSRLMSNRFATSRASLSSDSSAVASSSSRSSVVQRTSVLRTPLASAKAAVSSLRSTEVRWTTEERDELLATAEESLDKLARLVANLLDMSRLRAGALSVFPRAVGLDEIVPLALDELGADGEDISVDVPATLPEVLADPGLLERVIANLVANAVRFSPPGRPPRVAASALGSRVELRVADRGPGIPAENRDRVFAPFQRLGDRDNSTGVGLGLALSRGLVEAMNGALHPEDTPGGGLTMVVSLPAASAPGYRTPRPRRPRACAGEPRAGRRRRTADPAGAASEPARPPARGSPAQALG